MIFYHLLLKTRLNNQICMFACRYKLLRVTDISESAVAYRQLRNHSTFSNLSIKVGIFDFELQTHGCKRLLISCTC